MPTTYEPVIETLPEEECRRLLACVPIGRLAFTVGALPAIQPVRFTLRGDEVLIPARRGGQVAGASRGAVVAFQVDEYHAGSRSGWSVTVVGPSRVLADAGGVTALRGAGLAPCTPAPESCVVAVRVARISGRRVSGARSPSDDGATSPAPGQRART